MTKDSSTDKLKAKLAAIEHERWADWQKWCHEVLYKELGWSDRLEKVLERWKVQIETPYAELSDKEKASDMEQVDRYWPLIEAYITKASTLRAIEELEKIAEQYCEVRDETMGKPIVLKAVTLYRIKHRINTLKGKQ